MSDKEKSGCIFCDIAIGNAPAYIVYQDDVILAFLDKRPVFAGHCLVVPKKHFATLTDIPSYIMEPLFANAKLISKAIEASMGAGGTFIAINNKVSQSVPHFHIHVIPRTKGDGLKGFFWPRMRYRDEEYVEQVRDRIAQAVSTTRDY
ncbi:MAG: HIT family protein [Chloroflexota bacterium]|nr:HIT family protein [Chloroflexota bacterium]